MREAIEAARIEADVHVVNDGNKAVLFFDSADSDDSAPCPVLVILDLNLPKRSGTEVLEHIRKSRKGSGALVIIATSSGSPRDREETARLGATEYFRKPSDYEAYLKLGEIVQRMLGSDELAV